MLIPQHSYKIDFHPQKKGQELVLTKTVQELTVAEDEIEMKFPPPTGKATLRYAPYAFIPLPVFIVY